MNKAKGSRRRKQSVRERLVANSWLLIPVGVIGAVGVLALTQQQPEKAETFTVNTPGKPLAAQSPGAKLPGETIPDLGRKHVPETETISYNSNPPTSGSHYDTPASWGIHLQPPKDEALVHNLEHGGIVISYNPNQVKGEDLKQLRSQVRELSKTNPRLVLTPRSSLDVPIALSAWTYLQKLDSYDAAAVQAFYEAHIARGPECQQGQCPG